jgi:spore coat protein U-like protein
MRSFLLVLPVFLAASPAMAYSESGSIDISVTASTGCSIETSPLTFTVAYTGLEELQGQTNINVTCAYDIPSAIFELDGGLHASGGQRYLLSDSSGGSLSYTAYYVSSSTFTDVLWGDGIEYGEQAFYAMGAGVNSFPLRVRIPSGQYAPRGDAFTDTVAVTMSY